MSAMMAPESIEYDQNVPWDILNHSLEGETYNNL